MNAGFEEEANTASTGFLILEKQRPPPLQTNEVPWVRHPGTRGPGEGGEGEEQETAGLLGEFSTSGLRA